MRAEHANTVLKALCSIRTNRNNERKPRAGICPSVSGALLDPHGNYDRSADAAWNDWKSGAFVQWPEFSGDRSYPVVGGHKAYGLAWRDASMWEGEYGAARLRLLDFLIEHLERQIIEGVHNDE